MSIDSLFTKIYNFLKYAEPRHIIAETVIYKAFQENCWISQDDLRPVVEQAISLVMSNCASDSPKLAKFEDVLTRFNGAYDNVRSLRDLGALDLNLEKPVQK
ncbi:10815_t:CDS:2 [Paraglomus occultum]|uniref:10815_t:CDS:1 n=1 Tax=Paraglomus occultum TaxID=144539 RepID=A0A9N9BXC9_9GLOM|nr:10815_t:CDS:2 [Paraglomus occultum]